MNASYKKGGRQNVNEGNFTQINVKQETEEPVESLRTEISYIMHGYGDCVRPLKESVDLVEKIVCQQLRGIAHDAADVAMRRKGVPMPVQTDFEFLMRKHPVKISRMRKHLQDLKSLKLSLERQAGRPVPSEESNGDTQSDEDAKIDVTPKYDEERTRRYFRADRISQILTGPQYQYYTQARVTTLYSEKHKQRLKNMLNLSPEILLPPASLTVLAHLAHETIATLVDYAILTRLNSENRVTDPYSRVTSAGVSYAMHRMCPEVTQGRGADAAKPITVQEIREALRRFMLLSKRGMGYQRTIIDSDLRKCYLAI